MSKKIMRIAVCMALCLCMSLCMGVTAFASGGDETQEPITDPIFTEETEPVVEIGELTPLTPDGNATLVDNVDEEDGKLFYTFKTANDTYFYLVIDEAKDSDNVYMLNLIDEEDLLAAIAEAEGNNTSGLGSGTQVGLKDEEPSPSVEEPATDEETMDPIVEEKPVTEKNTGNVGLYIVILLVGAGVIVGFYYFKIMKPKKDGRSLDDDMEFYDDEDYVNEDEPEIIEDADPEFEEDEEDQKDGE